VREGMLSVVVVRYCRGEGSDVVWRKREKRDVKMVVGSDAWDERKENSGRINREGRWTCSCGGG